MSRLLLTAGANLYLLIKLKDAANLDYSNMLRTFGFFKICLNTREPRAPQPISCKANQHDRISRDFKPVIRGHICSKSSIY